MGRSYGGLDPDYEPRGRGYYPNPVGPVRVSGRTFDGKHQDHPDDCGCDYCCFGTIPAGVEIKEIEMDFRANAPVVKSSSSSIREGKVEIEEEIERLGTNINDLFEVLDPILNGEYPTEDKGDSEFASNSAMGRDLREMATRLNHLNERLIILRRRIDL